jgi:hypothetical protein
MQYVVSSPARLKKVLRSLPDIEFRLGWLRDHLSATPLAEAADELHALCEEGEQSVPEAREAMLSVAVLFAELGECEFVQLLRGEAHARSLLSLERFLRRGADSPRVDPPVEEIPVPDYGAGRELTVGERRSLARRPDRRAFEKLLSDPHPLVLRQLMLNPKLTEDDVLVLATRRPCRIAALRQIVAVPAWLSRRRVRMAILLNPGAPSHIAMPLLILCTRQELQEIAKATDIPLVLRVSARELFERRPPLDAVDTDTALQ